MAVGEQLVTHDRHYRCRFLRSGYTLFVTASPSNRPRISPAQLPELPRGTYFVGWEPSRLRALKISASALTSTVRALARGAEEPL
ncbi:hypothetical protein [Qaidamihabitans albus]|uniref:hypothetical protein n=1 Tax=Qaidamihabitans albus TaxID=2795733 RepID=UPI0018F154B4|nr:hypothetical protein [Qaidamihabitans albus]